MSYSKLWSVNIWRETTKTITASGWNRTHSSASHHPRHTLDPCYWSAQGSNGEKGPIWAGRLRFLTWAQSIWVWSLGLSLGGWKCSPPAWGLSVPVRTCRNTQWQGWSLEDKVTMRALQVMVKGDLATSFTFVSTYFSSSLSFERIIKDLRRGII